MWKVLKDDFLMGAKLKDWDKKANDEEEQLSEAESIGSEGKKFIFISDTPFVIIYMYYSVE